jgi:hypothetical protein
MLIESKINIIGDFNANWTDEQIKNEPMLFNCSLDGAYALGGPITREFIRTLYQTEEGKKIFDGKSVIDSRSHMLMPGWYPCIPGWHHDDVPRSGFNGQPNYINPEYRSKHVMGLVNAHVCPTQFALGMIDLDVPQDGIIYKQWHPLVKAAVESGSMKSQSAESGKLIHFDDRTFHQGTAAIASGWRWFIRLSYNTDRANKCTNEIRNQVQVYLEHPMEGW